MLLFCLFVACRFGVWSSCQLATDLVLFSEGGRETSSLHEERMKPSATRAAHML